MIKSSAFTDATPIAISYRPKAHDYLPVVVAAIRRFLGDWPIVLLTEAQHLPPQAWLEAWQVEAITDWAHSENANKVLRLWEHQEIFAAHFARWIWWHDDMLLLRAVPDPTTVFSVPRVRHLARARPNKKLSNWHVWLWDTLGFFESLSMPSHNPVCHIPRLIDRDVLHSVPRSWNRRRLLFEPTYLLWHWHQMDTEVELSENFRTCVFKGEMPALDSLADTGATVLNWGRRIDHAAAQAAFAAHYPVSFAGRPD